MKKEIIQKIANKIYPIIPLEVENEDPTIILSDEKKLENFRLTIESASKNLGFVKGFEEGEKVNKLTWKDINNLEKIINQVHSEFRNGINEKNFGEEVLDRFNSGRDFESQDDEIKLTIIPESKYKDYLRYCLNKKYKSTVMCKCGNIVDVDIFPYGYDDENNDIYFGSICPKCGKLIITKE